jgi:hypothetical protein
MSPECSNPIDPSSPPASENRVPPSSTPAPHRLDRTEQDPDVLTRLEWLDDLMFAAINGDPASLQTAADAWNQALQELGSDALEESRRQYLRCAQSVWHDLRSKPNHPPHKVFAAIEIISLLAEKAW